MDFVDVAQKNIHLEIWRSWSSYMYTRGNKFTWLLRWTEAREGQRWGLMLFCYVIPTKIFTVASCGMSQNLIIFYEIWVCVKLFPRVYKYMWEKHSNHYISGSRSFSMTYIERKFGLLKILTRRRSSMLIGIIRHCVNFSALLSDIIRSVVSSRKSCGVKT